MVIDLSGTPCETSLCHEVKMKAGPTEDVGETGARGPEEEDMEEAQTLTKVFILRIVTIRSRP